MDSLTGEEAAEPPAVENHNLLALNFNSNNSKELEQEILKKMQFSFATFLNGEQEENAAQNAAFGLGEDVHVHEVEADQDQRTLADQVKLQGQVNENAPTFRNMR